MILRKGKAQRRLRYLEILSQTRNSFPLYLPTCQSLRKLLMYSSICLEGVSAIDSIRSERKKIKIKSYVIICSSLTSVVHPSPPCPGVLSHIFLLASFWGRISRQGQKNGPALLGLWRKDLELGMLLSATSKAGSPWVCVDVFHIEKRGVSIRR